MKAAVDEGLVTKVSDAIETFTPEDNKFALYDLVTDYLDALDIRDRRLEAELARLRVHAHAAITPSCSSVASLRDTAVFGDGTAGTPECAPRRACDEAEHNGFVVLERNLGDVRFPPFVAFASSVILFVLGLLMLHWYEKDRKEHRRRRAQAAAATTSTDARIASASRPTSEDRDAPCLIVLAQQLVDAGGEDGQGGLAFVLLVVLVAVICRRALLHGPRPQAAAERDEN